MAVRVRRGHAVGSNGRTRAMALSALALLAIAAGTPVGTAAAAPDPQPQHGVTCADETVRWGGFQVLDAAIPSFDTGVDVVARAGSTLTVVGVSADGLDPADRAHVMPVLVGGVPAVPGAVVDGGGDVVVSTDGREVLRSFGVTVVVRRCAEVAVAGPMAAAETAAPSDATTPDVTTPVAAPPATWPSAADAAAVVTTLPVTGRSSWVDTAIGAVLVAIGAALVTVGRRSGSDAR